MEWWKERCKENLAYDAKLTANKEKAMQEIRAILTLTPKEADLVKGVLHELISTTIVASGGSFHQWREPAK